MRKAIAILFFLTAPLAHAQNVLFPANPGDMIVKGTAGTWGPVPGGMAGCVLRSNGPTAAPTWQCSLPLNFQLPPMAVNTLWCNVSGAQAPATACNISQILSTIDYDIQRPPLAGSIPYVGANSIWHLAPPPAVVGWVWTAQGTGQAPQWVPPGGYVVPGVAGTCLVSNGPTVAPSFTTCPTATSFVASFAGRTGAVTPASGDYSVGQVTGAAPLASPPLTGVPTAPTAAVGTSTTQIATTASVIAQMGLYDPRSDGVAVCNGTSSSGVAASFATGLAAGKKLWLLPENCYYTTNTVPADVHVYCQNPTTSVISVVDPTADLLSIGARSRFMGCGFRSAFVTNSTTPIGVVKVAPNPGATYNDQDTAQFFGNYPWTPFNIYVGRNITGPTGAVSTDNQGLTINNDSTGDGFFQSTTYSGNNQLMWLYGIGDRGIFIESGKLGTEGDAHTALKIIDYSDGTTSPQRSIELVRYGNPEASFLFIDDNIAVPKTNPAISMSVAGQTSGNLLQMQHSTSTYAGNMISLTAEAGATGTFTGNFLECVRSTQKCKLDKDGNMTVAGAYVSGAATGQSTTVTVRDAAGTGTCTLIYTGGLKTGGTC